MEWKHKWWYVTIAPAPSTWRIKNIFSRRSGFCGYVVVTCLSCLQRTLAANVELATALTEKNRDWRKLKRAVELKDGQIASLEKARKKDQGKDSFYSDNQYLGSKFPLFVELLDTAEEVLRDNTDMQACMNEAADLATLVAKLKEELAKALEERDMKHGCRAEQADKAD